MIGKFSMGMGLRLFYLEPLEGREGREKTECEGLLGAKT